MSTTDGTIDYEEFQAMVKAWFLSETGLPRVYWEEEQRQSTSPFEQIGELNILSDTQLGVDDERYEDHPTPTPGAELQKIVAGNRLITVSCRVKSLRDQRPTKAARFFISRARTSLGDRTVLETFFQPFDIAFVRAAPLQNLDFTQQRRRASLSNMDVTFAAVVNRVGTETFIEKAEVSSDLKDAGGTSLPASLQLDDVEMP